MVRWFIVICLFCTSCFALPTYTTRHGIKVYDKTETITPTRQEIEGVVEYVANEIGNENFDKIKLHLYNYLIKVEREENGITKVFFADGYTNGKSGVIIISVLQMCFADSGIAHELAHIIHDYDKLNPDYLHKDRKFWDTVEQIEKKIIKDLCPNGYKSQKLPEIPVGKL